MNKERRKSCSDLYKQVIQRKFVMRKLILIALFVILSTQVMADVYTDEATFVAMLQPGYYLENFNDFIYQPYESPLPFGPVNGFSYNASAPGHLWGCIGALSTASDLELLTITFTGDPVTAVGGLFFGTDNDGYTIPSYVTVTLSNGTIESYETTGDVFRGFTSTIPISYLTIDTIYPGVANVWPTIDHFYVGNVVPVPGAVLLGMLGLSAVGIKLRKFA